jgi:hypothetical protein
MENSNTIFGIEDWKIYRRAVESVEKIHVDSKVSYKSLNPAAKRTKIRDKSLRAK